MTSVRSEGPGLKPHCENSHRCLGPEPSRPRAARGQTAADDEPSAPLSRPQAPGAAGCWGVAAACPAWSGEERGALGAKASHVPSPPRRLATPPRGHPGAKGTSCPQRALPGGHKPCAQAAGGVRASAVPRADTGGGNTRPGPAASGHPTVAHGVTLQGRGHVRPETRCTAPPSWALRLHSSPVLCLVSRVFYEPPWRGLSTFPRVATFTMLFSMDRFRSVTDQHK